ncbi:hypothetical protein [Photobacterium damselae]|uniref:hypothetical protein n=2 Tax=Photobacterium damselae TaxID=38293 RepID=UPI0012FDE36E|nr:hypothetical protein [Photobacterium damselae]
MLISSFNFRDNKYGNFPSWLCCFCLDHSFVDHEKYQNTALCKPCRMQLICYVWFDYSITIGELIQAAEQFTLEEIEIIAPKVAVCFGVATYNALLRAAKEQNRLKDASLKPVKNLNQAIEQPFLLSFSSKVKVWICAQSHPGGLGRACRNKGKVDRVSQDWQQMAQFVKQIPFA